MVTIELAASEEPAGQVNPWLARFRDPQLEADFRADHLPDQRRRALIVVGAATLAGTLNLVTELPRFLAGERALLGIVAMRCLVLVIGLGVLLWLRRERRPLALDVGLTAYGMVIVLLAQVLLAMHPGIGIMGPTTVACTVALIYFFAPLPFALIVLLTVTMSIGGWLAWAWLRVPLPAPDDAFRLFLWLLALNLVGLFGVNAGQRTNRALFWKQCELEAATRSLSVQRDQLERSFRREQATLGQYRQFAALIAHEFRNPLAIVKGKAQLLQLAARLRTPPDADALPAIERAVDRLDTLFNQWLASDQMEDGEIPFHVETVSVAALMRQVLDAALPSARHPLTLPPVDQRLLLQGDETLLRLAVLNLVDNAVKYSPAGGGIDLMVTADDRRVTIAVLDHGIGIEPAHVERIFEKNFRVRPESAIPGSGLGLFLVRRIVDLHGGEVEVDTAPGAGSRFRLLLPLAAPA